MYWQRLVTWVQTHVRLISYVTASLLITLWTLLRFYTARTIFDLVGQQVLAGQWLHGQIAGSAVGVTNYIPKIFLLYMPLHALPGSPRTKLILLTIAVNVVTLVLLGMVLERLLKVLGIKTSGAVGAMTIWLGAVAGSVFWVQFTNSRNLEVVGGVFLLYLGLRYLGTPSRKRLLAIGALSVVLFFADTLQLYMTAFPLLLYSICVRRGAAELRRVGLLAAAIIAGFAGSKLVFILFSHIFSVEFLQAGTSMHLSAHFIGQGIVGTLKALVHLYAGGADVGKLREVCNILFLLGVGGMFIYAVRKRLISRTAILLAGIIWATNAAVYILSGQAQQTGTERYLIMTVPAFMLVAGTFAALKIKLWRLSWAAITLLFLVNFLWIGHGLVRANHHFIQDAHLASVHRYLEQHTDTLAYGSMDTAIPIAYLYNAQTPLPVTCAPGGKLNKTDTFYSRSAYKAREGVPHRSIAIVLDQTIISNAPRVCSEANIVAQLGTPRQIDSTDDGSHVLVYSQSLAKPLRY